MVVPYRKSTAARRENTESIAIAGNKQLYFIRLTGISQHRQLFHPSPSYKRYMSLPALQRFVVLSSAHRGDILAEWQIESRPFPVYKPQLPVVPHNDVPHGQVIMSQYQRLYRQILARRPTARRRSRGAVWSSGTDLHVCIRRAIVDRDIVEEYPPWVPGCGSDGSYLRLCAARGRNRGGSTQRGISATETETSRRY
jgi:hypothetical protein